MLLSDLLTLCWVLSLLRENRPGGRQCAIATSPSRPGAQQANPGRPGGVQGAHHRHQADSSPRHACRGIAPRHHSGSLGNLLQICILQHATAEVLACKADREKHRGWQANYRDYILSGKCGGSGKDGDDGDGDEDASALERWQNVETLAEMAAQHADRPMLLDMPDIDAEVMLPEVLLPRVRTASRWPHGTDAVV